MTKNDVVFTALFGQYETLNELEILRNSETRYVCFTDDPKLFSESWEIILVNTKMNDQPWRASREIKMLGHKYFPEGTRTLYIDNTVRLKVDGSIVLNSWLNNADVAFMRHYSRRTVRNEFFICAAYALDNQETIWSQFKFYRANFPQILSQAPHWGGMIARVNSEETNRFMGVWKQQFDSFSRRDQLSINVSSVISGVQIKTINARNDSSEWHEWPIHSNRNWRMRERIGTGKFRKSKIIFNGIRFGFRFYFPFMSFRRQLN